MKIGNIWLALAVFIFGLTISVQAQTETVPGNAWQIAISLQSPEIFPQAVQFAIFDEDPIPFFTSRLTKVRAVFLNTLKRDATVDEIQTIKDAQMSTIWDSMFEKVTGDQVYLLAALTTANPRPSILTANSPDGYKWLATKVTDALGRPICWYFKIKVVRGKETQILLTTDNAFNLSKLYHSMMMLQEE